MRKPVRKLLPLAAAFVALAAHADTVADWADITTDIATDGPNTIRTMALAENAVYEAVNAVTGRYPKDRVDLGSATGASIDAAIAAASRTVLLHEAKVVQDRTEAAYAKALNSIAPGDARDRGVRLGERAAADVLAKHMSDIGAIEPYRPLTSPGVYVPTTFPLGYAVAQHHPWFLKSASQFRPGPPPDLKSKLWARDYNEIKAVGALQSTERTAEQTEIARFWATALPDVHMGVVHSVAIAPGREVTRNARLYAAVTAALNDAEIAVFDAKYHYQFWRPITAIRNGDRDDNPRHRARCQLAADDRHPRATGIPVCALHYRGDDRRHDPRRARSRSGAPVELEEQYGARRDPPLDAHRGGGERGLRGPSVGRRALSQLVRGGGPDGRAGRRSSRSRIRTRALNRHLGCRSLKAPRRC